MQRWRVPLGFACAVVFVLLAKPDKLSLAVGKRFAREPVFAAGIRVMH